MADKITLCSAKGEEITAEADGKVFTLVIPFADEASAQRLLEYCADGSLKGQVVLVIDTTTRQTHEGSRALN